LIDVGKGALAVVLARYFFPGDMAVALGAVMMAVMGHIWPLFYDFRGGKGAATLVGGLMLAWPLALLPLLSVWVLCLLLTGYVGLSTVLAAISLLFSAYWWHVELVTWVFAALFAVLITYSHRSNLQRLRDGTESRFEKARVLGRFFFGQRG
jgi:glycerol-3-phosphate acyltransferase PlsY